MNLSFSSTLNSFLADVDSIEIVVTHPDGAIEMNADCGGLVNYSPLSSSVTCVGVSST